MQEFESFSYAPCSCMYLCIQIYSCTRWYKFRLKTTQRFYFIEYKSRLAIQIFRNSSQAFPLPWNFTRRLKFAYDIYIRTLIRLFNYPSMKKTSEHYLFHSASSVVGMCKCDLKLGPHSECFVLSNEFRKSTDDIVSTFLNTKQEAAFFIIRCLNSCMRVIPRIRCLLPRKVNASMIFHESVDLPLCKEQRSDP